MLGTAVLYAIFRAAPHAAGRRAHRRATQSSSRDEFCILRVAGIPFAWWEMRRTGDGVPALRQRCEGGTTVGHIEDSRPDLAWGAPSPKRFVLYRDEDATGVSGTGVVATGIVWPDGHAALRWKADDREAASSTSVWTSVADLMRVHGHGGLSKLFYLDGDGDPPDCGGAGARPRRRVLRGPFRLEPGTYCPPVVDTGLRTLWTRRGAAPLRAFISTESASAVVLVAAVVVALVWANAAPASYDRGVGHAGGAADRRRGVRPGPAGVGRRRPDDAVLPRRGPGGAARVRPRRPARAPPVRAAARGGGRRHGRADRHLPAVQRGPAERARVGRRDVDRHRARPRPPRDARPPRARQGAPVRPHDLRRRRPRRPARDRRRLQRADQRAAAGAGRGGVRAAAGGGPDDAAPLGVLRHRAHPVARAGGERRRPGRRGAGHRAVRARRTRRAATRWSRRPGACGSSASSRRPSWCARPRRASPPRCRRTPGCRASTTRGRAS